MLLPKPVSRAEEKQDRRKVKARNRREVYKLVRVRDHYSCRNCKSKDNLHHHHLTFRSRGGNDTIKNLVLLCAKCHADIHAYRLAIEGKDANGFLVFRWTYQG